LKLVAVGSDLTEVMLEGEGNDVAPTNSSLCELQLFIVAAKNYTKWSANETQVLRSQKFV